MKVISNFLSEENHKKLKNILESHTIPWYFNDKVVTDKDSPFQFTHPFYNGGMPSETIELIHPILMLLSPLSIIRAKANCTFKTDKNINTGSHTDNKQKGLKSAVYFVNDNDGYLHNFEEKKSVKSVANTMCIIDSNVLHAGFTCTNSDRRLVINICYLPDETYSHNRS
tara:strand:+ start:231 stop:737 length:507 start_codon:yes stop_codon:yes gene_type:complete